jgi:hypothetical protein
MAMARLWGMRGSKVVDQAQYNDIQNSNTTVLNVDYDGSVIPSEPGSLPRTRS